MYKNINTLKVLCFSLCLICVASQHYEFKEVTEIPSDIPRCNETDHNLNECIRNAFQQMIPKAVNGIPELNIQPIDPFEIERNTFEFSNNVVQGKMSLRHVKIFGLRKTVFKSVDYKRKEEKFTISVKAKIPKMLVEGRYKAEIKINNNNLNSKGEFNVTMLDVDINNMLEGEWYERNNHRYIRLHKFNVDPTVGNMRFRATGLLPDPVLNDALLDFFNQNWRDNYKSVIAETKSTWEPQFLRIGNEFFSHLPLEDILLQE